MNHFVFLFLFALIGYAGAEQIETQIYLASENNDKIGNNANYLFDEVGGRFEVKVIKPANSNTIKGFSIVYFSDKEDSWQFKFVIPAQQSIVIGKEYRYALSYPYQGYENAGIKVCRVFQDFNDLKGEFKILEYSLDSQGEITSLAIDFKQVAGNQGALNGSIRYHSNKPLTTDFNSSEDDPVSDIDHFPEGFYEHFFGFYSTPGEYFADGMHFFTENFSIGQHPWQEIWIEYGEDKFFNSPGTWGTLFGAPFNSILKKGIYLNARPWMSTDDPTMQFYGDGRWSNVTLGNFEVHEIEFNSKGDVKKFAVDFVIRAVYSGNQPLRGTIRYNSYIPPSTEAQIKAKLG